MSYENFIARKLLKKETQSKKVSRPIVRISVISIALSIVVNLITIAVVSGFQKEIRDKVTGFGSHLFIMNSTGGSIYESDPILKNQALIENIDLKDDIKSIHPVAYKPVIFQSDKFEKSFTIQQKDTTVIQQEIHGAMLKGVDENYDWSFIKEHLKSGKIPVYSNNSQSQDIVISSTIAKNLNVKVGSDIRAFFVKNQPIKRIFKVVGIYHTGLEEFDKKIAIGDIKNVQLLNDWGIQASITVDDTLYNHQLIIRGSVVGGNGNYRYNWSAGYENAAGFTLCPTKDTIIQLIASDYYTSLKENANETSIADTAYLKIKVDGNNLCDFKLDGENLLQKELLDDEGKKYQIKTTSSKIILEFIDGKGSARNYVGGFEVNVKNWNKLIETQEKLKKKVEFIPTENGDLLSVRSIIENENDIFVWLGFLDINVAIILFLMILIGIINMGSALLVLILMRSNFIGLMKSMGANNQMIRKIFLIQAAYLIIRGMIIGNIVGLLFIAIQYYLQPLTLNPAVYYLDKVPISFNFWSWLLLNFGTLTVCLVALIIPSFAITKINPAKTIKFN